MNYAYIVIGVPRSGTSCLCGILHHLGIRMALHDFIEPDIGNPTGYYEDKDFTETISNYQLPPLNGSLSSLHDLKLAKVKRNTIVKQAILERCKDGIPWGLKIIFSVEILLTVLDTCPMPVKILRTIRPQQSSTNSAKNLFGDYGDPISDFENEIIRVLSKVKNEVYKVEYNQLVQNPKLIVPKIAEFVELPVNDKAIDSVIPSLRHY